MSLGIQPVPPTTQPRRHRTPGSGGGRFSAPRHPQNQRSTPVALAQSEARRNLPTPQRRFLRRLSDTVLLQIGLFPESCCSAASFPGISRQDVVLGLATEYRESTGVTRNVRISDTQKTKQPSISNYFVLVQPSASFSRADVYWYHSNQYRPLRAPIARSKI